MKVALFGQTGQVGEALLEGCPKVQWIYVDRNRAGGDLCEPEEVYQWLLDTRPDAIVNAAAFTAVDRVPENYDEAMTVNVRAPAAMARAAKALGAYFIHLSTDYVFDGSGVKPWEPGDKVCPINAYGQTKAEAEKRIAGETDLFTILRLSWLHAPGHVNFVTSFCKRLQTQSEVSVVDDQWGSNGCCKISKINARYLALRILPIQAFVHAMTAPAKSSGSFKSQGRIGLKVKVFFGQRQRTFHQWSHAQETADSVPSNFAKNLTSPLALGKRRWLRHCLSIVKKKSTAVFLESPRVTAHVVKPVLSFPS